MPGREEVHAHWIAVLYRSGATWISNGLQPLKIGRGQYALLSELFYCDGVSQSELAQTLRLDKGTTARALRKLEDAGYVVRERDEADRRVYHVYLTDKARGVKDSLHSVMHGWSDTLTEGFSDGEQRQILAFLQGMARNAARALEAKAEERRL